MSLFHISRSIRSFLNINFNSAFNRFIVIIIVQNSNFSEQALSVLNAEYTRLV